MGDYAEQAGETELLPASLILKQGLQSPSSDLSKGKSISGRRLQPEVWVTQITQRS
jgi:hypothetical protein